MMICLKVIKDGNTEELYVSKEAIAVLVKAGELSRVTLHNGISYTVDEKVDSLKDRIGFQKTVLTEDL